VVIMNRDESLNRVASNIWVRAAVCLFFVQFHIVSHILAKFYAILNDSFELIDRKPFFLAHSVLCFL
jgi:hypothetical protein